MTDFFDLPRRSALSAQFEYDALRGILYMSDGGKTIRRMDLATREFLEPLVLAHKAGGLALSQDGRTLYAASHKYKAIDPILEPTRQFIDVIDTETGIVSAIGYVHKEGGKGTMDLAVTSDGYLNWTSRGDSMFFWRMDMATGETRKVRLPTIRSLDDKNLIVASETGDHLLLYNTAGGGHDTWVYDVVNTEFDLSFSDSEHRRLSAVTASDIGDISSAAGQVAQPYYQGRGLAVFDLEGGLAARIPGYRVDSFVFSDDGSQLHAFDRFRKSILTFNTETWDLVNAYELLHDFSKKQLDTIYYLQNLDSSDRFVLLGFDAMIVLDRDALAPGQWGSRGDDVMIGGDTADGLRGREGDDLIRGKGGEDVLAGSSGQDRLLGGKGGDQLLGGGGDDIAKGQGGRDRLEGNDGHDRLYGGAGRDWLSGHRGDDMLFGGAGNDRLISVGFRDVDQDILKGGAGDDWIKGGYGGDKLFGGKGNDTIIFLTATNAEAMGGAGDDLIVMTGRSSDARADGGAGNDRLMGGGGGTLVDGAGADELVGAWGAETFVFVKDSSTDVVRNFEFDKDRIDISDWGLSGPAGLTVLSVTSHSYSIAQGDNRLDVFFDPNLLSPFNWVSITDVLYTFIY